MRILVTGLGTFWGSRIAQRLEQRPDVELVVGVDEREPRLPLRRTEFVKADASYGILQRMVRATQVDTVLHTHLEVDSTRVSSRRLHEVNVIGTMNLLAAAAADGQLGAQARAQDVDAGLRLELRRSLLLPRDDPAHASADHPGRALAARGRRARRATSPRTTPTCRSRSLRFANVLGDDVTTVFSRMLRMPAVPEVFGFDPRLQFVHEDDVTRALEHATVTDAPGMFNVAGPGTITWGEACRLVGRRRLAMPPVLTGAAAVPMRLLRIIDIPPEVLSLLRYGRAVDTDAFVATGFDYGFTTLGDGRGLRARPTAGACRRHPAGVRVRARRRGLLPQLARWCARRLTRFGGPRPRVKPAYEKNFASNSARRSSHSSRVIA